MSNLVFIGRAATALGVAVSTPHRRESQGLFASTHMIGGHRRHDPDDLRKMILPSPDHMPEYPLE